jgi:hypothetical protein
VFQKVTEDNFNHFLGKFSTAELENVLEKFPYFQQGHVLLAKKYQQENNPRFDEQLQLAVLYTQDRALLFSLFSAQDITPLYEPPVILREPVIEAKPEADPLINTAGEERELVDIEILSEEPAIEMVDRKEPEAEGRIELEATVEEPFAEPVQTEVNETLEATKEVEAKAFIITQPHTFDDWLAAFAKQEVVKETEVIPETSLRIEEPEPEKELEQLYLANLPLQELVEEETHYSKGLDHFIEEQKLKHKPQEAKAVVNENELAPELITETMAKVYEAQKKYAKAIHAYEILAMKYPKKNDFFAARITELKNFI